MTNYDAEKFAGEIDIIVSNLTATLKCKNADYGNNVDKNIDEWGLISLAIRLDDKLGRFKNLIKEGLKREVSEEALEDTLLDLAGYAILGYRKLKEMNESVAVYDAEGFNKPIQTNTDTVHLISLLASKVKGETLPSKFTYN